MALSALKPDIADRFLPFCRVLQEIAADRLHSIYLSGSAVTPDYLPGISDINAVVVLVEVELRFIHRLAPLGRRFARQKISAPLIITPAYIANSLDVFPIEFLDLQLRHQVVVGHDLFADLQISNDDLRLQCEREIKTRIIRLRQDYLATTGQRRLLAETINRAFASLMPVCRGVVKLWGQEPPIPIIELLEKLAMVTALDTSALIDIFSFRQQQKLPDLERLNLVFANFYQLLEKLGKLVDAWSK